MSINHIYEIGFRIPKLLGLGLLFLLGCTSISLAATCDPQDALNDQARTLRVGGHLTEARTVVQHVLSMHPGDFRARYTDALIDLDQSKTNKTYWSRGMSKLTDAANNVDEEGGACAKAKNYYSIYNTIGAEYYNVRQYDLAQKYFLLAASHRDDLDSDTSNKLNDNLGLIAFIGHDYVCAAAYFQKADDAGLKSGASHLALVKNILAAASDTRTCKTLK